MVVDNERTEVLEFTKARIELMIAQHLKGHFGEGTADYENYRKQIGAPHVFAVSGSLALEGIETNNPQLLADSGLSSLQAALEQSFVHTQSTLNIRRLANRLIDCSDKILTEVNLLLEPERALAQDNLTLAMRESLRRQIDTLVQEQALTPQVLVELQHGLETMRQRAHDILMQLPRVTENEEDKPQPVDTVDEPEQVTILPTEAGIHVDNTLTSAVNTLQRLREIAEDIDLDTGEITAIDSALQQSQKPMSIAVIGEFKRGKSTLINALLGAEVLPANVLPTTATTIHVRYGPQPSVTIIYRDNEVQHEQIPLDRLAEYTTILTPESEATASRVKEAIISYPSPLLQNNIEIIDTTGLNDDRTMTEMALSVIPLSSVIILVMIVTSPFSAYHADFLENQILLQDLPKIIFVVTAIDRIRNEESSQVLEMINQRIETVITRRLRKQFGEGTVDYEHYRKQIGAPRLFAVSGSLALEGIETNNPQLLADSGLSSLQAALNESKARYSRTVQSPLLTQRILHASTKILTEIDTLLININDYQDDDAAAQLDSERSHRRVELETLRDETQTLLGQIREIAETRELDRLASATPTYPRGSFVDYRRTEFFLRTNLDRLRGFASLFDPNGNLLSQVEPFLKLHESNHFLIAVVGPYGSGKSAFLNALLGRDVLPTDVVACNAIPIRFTYGLNVGAWLDDQTPEEPRAIELENLAEYVTHTAMDANFENQHIKEAIVSYPWSYLENNVEFIDTPGWTDTQQFPSATVRILEEATTVILVLKAFPLTRRGRIRALLENIIFHPNVASVTFVATMRDQITDPADQEKAIDKVVLHTVVVRSCTMPARHYNDEQNTRLPRYDSRPSSRTTMLCAPGD
jgi:predicted GTPase